MSHFILKEAWAKKTGDAIELVFFGRVDESGSLISLEYDRKPVDAEIYMYTDPRYDISHPTGRVARVILPEAGKDLQILTDGQEDLSLPAADIEALAKKGPFRIRVLEKKRQENSLFLRGTVFAGENQPVLMELSEIADEDENPNPKRPEKADLPKIRRFEDPWLRLHFALPEGLECGFEFEIDPKKAGAASLILEAGEESLQIPLNDLLQDERSAGRNRSLKKGMDYLRQFGWKKSLFKVMEKGSGAITNLSYHNFALSKEPSKQLLEKQREQTFDFAPLISIVTAAYNTPVEYLEAMIRSLINQSYPNWELCLADASDNDSVRQWIESHPDSRIQYRRLSQNEGIAGNTNRALEMAKGEYIGFMDHDDLLREDCLYQIVSALQEKRFDMIYTDEDKLISETGQLAEPHFKPNFSLDLLRSENYITHFLVVSSDLAKKAGPFDDRYEGSQDYDFILRCAENAKRIGHIPQVLYHWRAHSNSTALRSESKMYCFENGRRALEDHLARCGIDAQTAMLPAPYYGKYRVRYALNPETTVSVVLTKPAAREDIADLAGNLAQKNPGLNFELLVPFACAEAGETETKKEAEHKSGPRKQNIHFCPAAQDSSKADALNQAALLAKGDLLLFLDPGLSAKEPDSVLELASLAMQPHIGAAGAKIVDDHSLVLSLGLVLRPDENRPASCAFEGLEYFHPGNQGRALIVSDFCALPLSCLMTRRGLFLEAGGFSDEIDEALIAPDYCRRTGRMGKWNAADPFALFMAKAGWQIDEKRHQGKLPPNWRHPDPFYNPNFSGKNGLFEIPEL